MEIGIIGFGRFGELAGKYLSKHFKVYAYDSQNKKYASNNNIIPSNLNEVCKKDVILLAVPISQLESVLNEIKNLVNENALVVDACSVKEYPVQLMKKILQIGRAHV